MISFPQTSSHMPVMSSFSRATFFSAMISFERRSIILETFTKRRDPSKGMSPRSDLIRSVDVKYESPATSALIQGSWDIVGLGRSLSQQPKTGMQAGKGNSSS